MNYLITFVIFYLAIAAINFAIFEYLYLNGKLKIDRTARYESTVHIWFALQAIRWPFLVVTREQ